MGEGSLRSMPTQQSIQHSPAGSSVMSVSRISSSAAVDPWPASALYSAHAPRGTLFPSRKSADYPFSTDAGK